MLLSVEFSQIFTRIIMTKITKLDGWTSIIIIEKHSSDSITNLDLMSISPSLVLKDFRACVAPRVNNVQVRVEFWMGEFWWQH